MVLVRWLRPICWLGIAPDLDLQNLDARAKLRFEQKVQNVAPHWLVVVIQQSRRCTCRQPSMTVEQLRRPRWVQRDRDRGRNNNNILCSVRNRTSICSGHCNAKPLHETCSSHGLRVWQWRRLPVVWMTWSGLTDGPTHKKGLSVFLINHNSWLFFLNLFFGRPLWPKPSGSTVPACGCCNGGAGILSHKQLTVDTRADTLYPNWVGGSWSWPLAIIVDLKSFGVKRFVRYQITRSTDVVSVFLKIDTLSSGKSL